MEHINEYTLTREAESLAAEIFEAFKELHGGAAFDAEAFESEMMEQAHESADGHQWVIYTHKAIRLCAECDTSDGEAFLEDVGLPSPVTFGGLATVIAYGEMQARIESALSDMVKAWEPEEEPEEEEEEEETI